MPAKLERCVAKVKPQLRKKYPKKNDKQITSSAFAICNASQNPQEAARWFKIDEDYLYLDIETMKLEEVVEGEIPGVATVYELKEVSLPGVKVKAAEGEEKEPPEPKESEGEDEDEAEDETEDEAKKKESEEEDEDEAEDEEEDESEDETEDEAKRPKKKKVKASEGEEEPDADDEPPAKKKEAEEEDEDEAASDEEEPDADDAPPAKKKEAKKKEADADGDEPDADDEPKKKEAKKKEAVLPKAKAAESVGDDSVGDKVEEIAKRKDVSPADKKRAQKEYGNVQYADEKNKKYPLDAKHVGPAWNYIHQKRNAAKYSPDELARIKSKIARAFQRERGHPPPETKETEQADMFPECDDMSPDGTYSPKENDVKPGEDKSAKTKTQKESIREAELPGAHAHKHMHIGKLPHAHLHEHHMMHEASENDQPHMHDHNPADEPKEGVTSTSVMPTLTRTDMGKKESVRTILFAEAQSLKEATVNKLKKTVEVTLIEPGWSVNGRYYSPEALKQAIPVFEGAKCYVNHPTMSEEKERPERSVDDIAGYYTNVRQSDGGRLTGVLNIVGVRGENIYPLVCEAAEKKPDLVGLSINALGKTRTGEAQGRTGVIVDEIVKAFGTDIVTTPSAGGKFDRLMQSGDEMTAALLKTLEFDEWRNANPEFLARIKKEMRTLRKDELESTNTKEATAAKEAYQALEQVATKKIARIRELKEQVASLKTKLTTQERETAIRVSEAVADYKLLASKLPEKWAKPLREALVGKTPEEMDGLIDQEREKYFSVKEPVQVFNAGAPKEPENYVPPDLVEVANVLHTGHTVFPLDNESPDEYQARKRKILGEQ